MTLSIQFTNLKNLPIPTESHFAKFNAYQNYLLYGSSCSVGFSKVFQLGITAKLNSNYGFNHLHFILCCIVFSSTCFILTAVMPKSDIGSSNGLPEDLTCFREFPSQSEKSASFIGTAKTDSVHMDNPWVDEVDYTDGGVEDSHDVEQDYLISETRLQSCHVLKRAPLGSYITVTSSEGDRVYLRMKSKEPESNQSGLLHAQSGLQLLKVPFSELKESVEEEVN